MARTWQGEDIAASVSSAPGQEAWRAGRNCPAIGRAVPTETALPLAWVCLGVAAVLVLVVGCSREEVGHVSGKVTVDGKPVGQGSVLFQDTAAGISVHAELQPDGSYTAKTYDRDGLPPGTYRVAITPSTFGHQEAPLVGEAGPQGRDQAKGSIIPKKYRSVETSGLSVTVEAGENEPFDFRLSP